MRLIIATLSLLVLVGSIRVYGEPMVGGEAELLPESVFPRLDAALRQSLDYSFRMVEESFRQEEARGEAEARASGLYPSVSGNFRYLARLEERDDRERRRRDTQPQAGLMVRQPLYHWGALRAESRVGRIRQAIAEHNRAEAYRLLALEIRGQFLDLVVRAKELEVAAYEHELAEQELRRGERLLEREEIAQEEVRELRLNAEEHQLRKERREAEYRLAERDFSRVVGVEVTEDTGIPAGVPYLGVEASDEPSRFRELIRKDGRYLPRMDAARKRVDEAESRRDAERSRVRPQLNLVAGVTQDQVAVFDRGDIDRTVGFAGLEVTWNLFDGYEARGRRAAANARRRMEEQRRNREEREWAAEVERLESTLGFLQRELNLAEDRLVLERERLERDERALEAGRISSREMSLARIEYMQRELAATERRAEYLMGFAEFLSEAGFDPVMDYYRERARRRGKDVE